MKKAITTALAIAIIGTAQAAPISDYTSDILTSVTVSAADTSVPAQVTGVNATDVKYTSATLNWKKVSGAKGYRVYVYNAASGKYKKIKTITKNSTTSLDLTGLKAGTTQKYKVRAYKKVNGKNVWGKCCKAYTLTTKSYAPAQIKGVKATKTTKTAVTLTWNKNSKATGYRIYKYNASTKKYEKVTTSAKNSTTTYKVTGLKAGTTYKFKVRGYRNYNGKTYWGTPSAAYKVTTNSDASAAAVDKAYQSLIVGNSTAEQRELVRQDIIAYTKKAHPELTFDERIYAWEDKNGNPTLIFADAVKAGNCCFTEGIDLDQEQTAYYFMNDTGWAGEAMRKTYGNYTLESLAQGLKKNCYESVDDDVAYWNSNRVLDRFNIVIYLWDDANAIIQNTGKYIEPWTIVTCLSNKDLIEGV